MTAPTIAEVALALALAWGAGIRVYAVLFLCGLAGQQGWIELPGNLSLLSHPLVLGASGFMLAVEFLADKVPWIDSVWDAVHTFIRIPAGAALVTMAFADSPGAGAAAAAILGGAVAAGAHFAKAGARSSINLSPEPFSNWAASFTEDALSLGALWVALKYPLLFLGLLAAFILIALWLLPKLWRGIRRIATTIRRAINGT